GDPSSITAQSLMIPVSVTISDSRTLADAMHILLSSHLDQVPVLDEKRQIVGVIRALDIVREWVEDTPGKTTRRCPGSKNLKRYQDVLDILNAGISVVTAVNIQHIESLNDAVTRITGVQ